MKHKGILRKVLSAVSWLLFVYLGIWLWNNNVGHGFIKVGLLIVCAIIALCVILLIILRIIIKVLTFNQYKAIKKLYYNLKDIHEARYKLYFTSEKEKINIYTQHIQERGEFLLYIGNDLLCTGKPSGKIKNEIQEILDKTQELMQNDFVPY